MINLKIVHCADVHLDSAFAAYESSVSDKRRLALRSAFSTLTLYAKTEGVKLFIISGDLFDSECVTKDTVQMLSREMSSIPDCKFVITPGNHDPYNSDSPYRLFEFPSNVYIFETPEISFFEFSELGARVYGYAFTSDTYTARPLKGFKLPDDGFDGLNILAAHCDFGHETSYYAPITEEDIQNSGFDYIAMGHIHKACPVSRIGKTLYAYSGCLEGRSFDETGIKGAVTGELSKDKAELKHRRFCSKYYEKVTCDVSGSRSFSDCVPSILEKCKGFGNDCILRITLDGITSTDFCFDKQSISAVLPNVSDIEVRDETLALLDVNNLEQSATLSGEFYRQLKDRLMSDDENTHKTAAGALRFGLRAINGMDIK